MNSFSTEDLQHFLQQKITEYKTPAFIEEDPIQIPKQFTRKQDIEIAGLIAATLAWGNRKSIIKSAQKTMHMLDDAPYDFVLHAQNSDMKHWKGNIHRTFMAEDLRYFVQQLQRIYKSNDCLENYFVPQENESNIMQGISRFRQNFIQEPHRAKKHISNPAKNSAAKRLNMFLRWMVRKDAIDFGIWQSISPAQLILPLDVHTANVGRKLGLLERKQNDRKAAEEITERLRHFQPEDPVEFDFALFGLGVFEKF